MDQTQTVSKQWLPACLTFQPSVSHCLLHTHSTAELEVPAPEACNAPARLSAQICHNYNCWRTLVGTQLYLFLSACTELVHASDHACTLSACRRAGYITQQDCCQLCRKTWGCKWWTLLLDDSNVSQLAGQPPGCCCHAHSLSLMAATCPDCVQPGSQLHRRTASAVLAASHAELPLSCAVSSSALTPRHLPGIQVLAAASLSPSLRPAPACRTTGSAGWQEISPRIRRLFSTTPGAKRLG
jgi:hypothetical protein